MKIIELGDSSHLTGELTRGKIVVQSFTALNTKLVGFGINFGTYKRLNQGHLVFKIMSDDSKNLFEKKVNVRDIHNNKFYDIETNVKLKKKKQYFLLVYSVDGETDHSVSAKYKLCETSEKFSITGKQLQGELHCYLKYDKDISKAIAPRDDIEGLISIVIPTHNSARLLKDTLRSIAIQTYNNVEVIVVDDKSSTLERSAIKSTIKESPLKIQSIMKQKNGGAADARNAGAEKATGEFLFFCDSDVVLEADCLEEMLQCLHDNPESSWAYSNYKIGEKELTFKKFSKKIFKEKNICSTMSLLRTKHFPKFHPELQRLQDWDLFLSMIEDGCSGKWIDQCLFTAADRAGITTDSISWEEAVKELKVYHPDM